MKNLLHLRANVSRLDNWILALNRGDVHIDSSDLRLLRDTKFDSANRLEITRLFRSGMFWDDPYLQHLDEILDAALEGGSSDVVRIAKNDEDRLFLETIGSGRKALESMAVGHNHYKIGNEFDFLARSDSEWNLIRVVNYLKLNSIRPTKRLAILTSIRNEGINILEWLAHYRILGADSIIVYANENDDGSDDLLTSLSTAGLITFVQNNTQSTGVVNVQRKAFEHALNFLRELWDHEWIFFIDADEFLILKGGAGIASILNAIEGDSVSTGSSGICLNWKWFGSGAQFHREARLMLEQYTYSGATRQVKTIVKLRDVTGFRTSHCPNMLAGCHFVDASLARLDGPQVDIDPAYDVGQINHYWNKSFEEFLVKSMRGNWDREPKQFFQWGNMGKGDYDPLPVGWADKIQAEISRMLALPGVREQAGAIEENFKAMIDALDRERDIRKMYEDARQAAGAS